MEKSDKNRAKYIKFKIVSNKIGNKGCFYLSRMKSTTLTTIFLSLTYTNLDNNEICSSGLMHLSKAEWKNLKTIVLCTFVIIRL